MVACLPCPGGAEERAVAATYRPSPIPSPLRGELATCHFHGLRCAPPVATVRPPLRGYGTRCVAYGFHIRLDGSNGTSLSWVRKSISCAIRPRDGRRIA